MEQIPQNIIEKIQKLLNLKEGAEAVNSLAEAENASAKLQALLMKYNLDLNQVASQNIANRAKVDIEEVYWDTSQYTKKSESFWIPRLFTGVARNNLCKVWWSRGNFVVNIIGHSHNLALVQYICEQLIAKIRIAEGHAWKTYNRDNPYGEKRGTFRRGFLEGAAIGIENRLEDEYYKMQTNHDNNPYAVMIVSKKKELDDWLKKKYPPPPTRTPEELEELKKLKPKKFKLPKGPRQNSSRDGWHLGKEAGEKMEINKGVDGSKSSGLLK
jgi:uncharacterized protein DUF2786